MTKVYCHECGFQNTEEGKYCSKCGALLPEEETGAEATIRYSPGPDDEEPDFDDLDRSGQGRGITGRPERGRAGRRNLHAWPVKRQPSAGTPIATSSLMTSPSRATMRVLIQKPDGFYIQDQGSLNGTYVNRARVETQKLSDGDQVQVGKYKLTFIER